MITNIEEKYGVGALLYTPALNHKLADYIIKERFIAPFSLAICLEDTITDLHVEQAEHQLVSTIKKIYKNIQSDFYLPKIFVRVRNSSQIKEICSELAESFEIVTGFIFPKYTLVNADEFNNAMLSINSNTNRKIYMMPILESSDIVDYKTRYEVLNGIKEKLEPVRELVLNVRVGGNDFSNVFSTRRHYDETIYDILPISQILGDILTIFSRDYVVSGPVWEYFSSDNDEWKNGLMKELKLDKLNGFIGKTVIHPKQISVVNESLKVSYKDYEDAKNILNWDEQEVQVGKSFAGERMNEVKTHINWAYRTMVLADIYGVL